MSARNLPVYGYPRNTSPISLINSPDRANVYHSHNSARNFPVPGTTSLLTGLYPWTHQALNEAGLMAREFILEEISSDRLKGIYKRLAFAQNLYVGFILDELDKDIDIYLSPDAFNVASGIVGRRFPNDFPSAYRSFDDFLFKFDKDSSKPASASLIFGTIERLLFFLRQLAERQKHVFAEYSTGFARR